jgi:hypothetical protein
VSISNEWDLREDCEFSPAVFEHHAARPTIRTGAPIFSFSFPFQATGDGHEFSVHAIGDLAGADCDFDRPQKRPVLVMATIRPDEVHPRQAATVRLMKLPTPAELRGTCVSQDQLKDERTSQACLMMEIDIPSSTRSLASIKRLKFVAESRQRDTVRSRKRSRVRDQIRYVICATA